MNLERFLADLRAEQQADDRLWVHPIAGLEMIRIPTGPALLGRPSAPVDVSGFSLSRHPVTNARFAVFLNHTGHTPIDPDGFLSHWPAPGEPPPDLLEHPVVHLSWFDAMAYCDWAGMTLPTEWMWEKAARGIDGRPYPWGDQSPRWRSSLTQVNKKKTAAVGSFPRTRTPWGCEDLIGNVSEWCWPSLNHAERPILDPQTEPPQHPVRGSAYMRKTGQGPRMTAAHRRMLSATRRNHWVGFRPAVLS